MSMDEVGRAIERLERVNVSFFGAGRRLGFTEIRITAELVALLKPLSRMFNGSKADEYCDWSGPGADEEAAVYDAREAFFALARKITGEKETG